MVRNWGNRVLCVGRHYLAFSNVGCFSGKFLQKDKDFRKGLEDLGKYANKINSYRCDLEVRVKGLERSTKINERSSQE